VVRHLVVVATNIALGAASLRAQRLPEVKDVQHVLSAAQAGGRRVGVELRNTSMLYGTVVDVKGNRVVVGVLVSIAVRGGGIGR